MKTREFLIYSGISIFLITLVFIGGCGTGDTRIDASKNQDQDRIIKLESRIAKLEQLLLQTAPYPKQAETPKPVSMPGGWQSLGNWSKVKEGMSFDQVAQILGKPTKTDMYGIDSGQWYYEGHLKEAGATVSGKIFFYERRVSSVDPPVF